MCITPICVKLAHVQTMCTRLPLFAPLPAIHAREPGTRLKPYIGI